MFKAPQVLFSALSLLGCSTAQDTVYTATLTALSSSGVTGEVTVFARSSVSVSFIGSASGLEASLSATTNCTATNGCGVHVHSGTACTNSSTQGGHYHSGPPDPWASIMYPSTSSAGAATFSGTITSSATSVLGKPFIVHNNAGGRVACGLLAAVTSGVSYTMLSALGSSGVTGSVTTYVTSSAVLAAGSATGLEASLSSSLTGGSDCTATNGCGVHVHSGSGCADTSSQGGHLYSTSSDPWGSVRYSNTTSSGTATFAIKALAGLSNVCGYPFLVHNNAGSRVACGILNSTSSPCSLRTTTARMTTTTTRTAVGTAWGPSTGTATASVSFSLMAHLMTHFAFMAAALRMLP